MAALLFICNSPIALGFFLELWDALSHSILRDKRMLLLGGVVVVVVVAVGCHGDSCCWPNFMLTARCSVRKKAGIDPDAYGRDKAKSLDSLLKVGRPKGRNFWGC